MLRQLNESVVAMVIFYPVVCWEGSMKVADAKRLQLIEKAGSAVREELDTLEIVAERIMSSRLQYVMGDVDHPLHNDLTDNYL